MTPDHETHIRNDQTRRCTCKVGSNSVGVDSACPKHGFLHGQIAHPSPDYTRGREQGLRDALEAVKYVTDRTHRGYLASIEALLPRDPVKALVKEWEESAFWSRGVLSDDCDAVENILHWLHTTGRLATQGEVR